MAIDFSVSSEQFVPGASLTLPARLINLKNNQPLPYYHCVKFWRWDAGGNSVFVGKANTSENGVATLVTNYPSVWDAYAYSASADYGGEEQPQNMASNPVQLSVGFNSTVLLSVHKEPNSNSHRFMARLVDKDRNGLNGKLLRLKLNETEYEAKWTNSNGNATWTLELSPKDNNMTTYNIAVSFEGDAAKTANAYMTTPNGTSVAACTTIQYSGYKPSANSTSITVRPQTTEGATTLISQEDLQAKADQNTHTEHQFLLGWPPYLMHTYMTLRAASIHLAFNPIFPGGEIAEFNGLDLILPPIPPPTPETWPPQPPPPDETSRIISAIVTSAIKNVMGISIAAVAGGLIPVLGPAYIALGAYAVTSAIWLGMALNQYSSPEPGAHIKALAQLAGLAIAFLGNAVGVVLPFVHSLFFKTAALPLLTTFLTNLIDPMSLESALHTAWDLLVVALSAMFALLLIPLPTSQIFKAGFFSLSIAFFVTTLGFLMVLRP